MAKRTPRNLACTKIGNTHRLVHVLRYNPAGGSYTVELIPGPARLTIPAYDLHDEHQYVEGRRVRLLTDVTLHYKPHGPNNECSEGCTKEHVPAGTLGTVTYLLNDEGEGNDFGVAWDNGDNVEVCYEDVEPA